MPALTFSTRRTICLLALSLTTSALPLHAQPSDLPFSCIVAHEAPDGVWVATTMVNASTGIASHSSETYQWTPNEKASFDTGATFTWDLSYQWPKHPPTQKAIPESDVVVSLHFKFDAKEIGQLLKEPSRASIHLYRSSDPERRFSSSWTSLTGPIDANLLANGNVSARALLSLDDLLAYGTGLDTLVWNIRAPGPNPYVGTDVFFKGTVPVAAMRDKVKMIPKLSRLLARKAANFRSECTLPIPTDIVG